MTNELKPCPFCGGEARYGLVDVKEDYTEYWIQKPTVHCNKCYINVGAHRNNEDAAKEWNTRQPIFDWKPIEELPTFFNSRGEKKL